MNGLKISGADNRTKVFQYGEMEAEFIDLAEKRGIPCDTPEETTVIYIPKQKTVPTITYTSPLPVIIVYKSPVILVAREETYRLNKKTPFYLRPDVKALSSHWRKSRLWGVALVLAFIVVALYSTFGSNGFTDIRKSIDYITHGYHRFSELPEEYINLVPEFERKALCADMLNINVNQTEVDFGPYTAEDIDKATRLWIDALWENKIFDLKLIPLLCSIVGDSSLHPRTCESAHQDERD